jgi:hypothetical protein
MSGGVTVTFGSLPRAATLTDVLLAPPVTSLTAHELTSVRSILERDVASVIRHVDRSEPLRVDPFRVRRTVTGVPDREQPFQWNPWTARRQLGLEVVRTSLGRPHLSPLEATRDAISRLIRHASEDRDPGTLSGWIAGLPLGARAVVEAEAVLWATQLLSAVVWTQPAARLVGFDRSVVPCDAPRVIVRGRVDVELRPACHPDQDAHAPTGGILVMMTGHPLPSARLELAVTALATALSDRPGNVPARVVGFWPQSGRALSLPINVDLLLRGSGAVVETIRSDVEGSLRRLPKRQAHEAVQSLPERAAS